MSPSTVGRVQNSANKTHWTLAQQHHDTRNHHLLLTPAPSPPGKATDSIMQANGYHHRPQQQHYDQREPPLPRYSDYDGSHYDGSRYSVASERDSRDSVPDWQPPRLVNGGEFEAFDFHHTPVNEVTTLNLDTSNAVRTPHPDGVGRHMLYETALMDTQHFEILDMDEVDALKKEQTRLNSRIDAAQRKLVLESKVRDAAQNLQRLYSTNKRPDTPQSPESPHKKRNSLLPGSRPRGGSTNGPETFRQADNELASSVKKVDDLHEQIKGLLDRRQEVERRLLRHTAAVLAEEANRVVESAVPGVVNGHRLDDDYRGSYALNDFDGIRDILQGKPAGAGGSSKQYEDQLASMQNRLEQLNSQLRNVISEAGQTLGKTPSAEVGLDQSSDPNTRIENRFARLEQNLHTLEEQQHNFREAEEQNMHTLEQLERDAKSMEEQMESVNSQLHNALLQASDNEPVAGLQGPPKPGGHGYQGQLQYMEDGLTTLEQLLQQRAQSGSLADSQAKVEELSKKTNDYEATVGGLWEILQSDGALSQADQDEGNTPSTPIREAFSLSAFSSRVQHVFDRAQSAREQQDILRRQIQQQRELGGKSDMEKDRQIADIQGKHEQAQQELANLMVKHEQTTGEASESRSELAKVMDEVEAMRQAMEEMKKNEGAAESKHGEMHQNMEKLETEIVRLTTELTMAKAELDGAYGTRAERAGAQAAEVESLNSRNKDMSSELESMRTELQEMTNEFQELTKESISLEKEREQLDALVDRLRDQCENLEAQLNDERVARIGLQKTEEKEARSMLVLKQEFKKMMREQKAEGSRLLRAEQDERRKLEAEVRKMRQANGPLNKTPQTSSEAAPTA